MKSLAGFALVLYLAYAIAAHAEGVEPKGSKALAVLNWLASFAIGAALTWAILTA